MYKTLLIAVLALARLVSPNLNAQGAGDAASIIAKLGAQPVKTPIALDYEVFVETSPLKGGPEAVDRKMREFRAQIGLFETPKSKDQALEQLSQNVRTLYEKGEKRLVSGATLFLANDYSALVRVGEMRAGERAENWWEIRKGDLYFDLSSRNGRATILKKGVGGAFQTRQDEIEQANESLGLLGGLPAEILGPDLKEAKVTVRGGITRIEAQQHFVDLARREDGTFEVRSFGHHYPKYEQSKKTTFYDYRPFGDLRLPTAVTVKFENAEIATVKTYKILAVRTASEEMRIPFINADFGLIWVHDCRFPEPVGYMASAKLPPDEVIETWRADPAALRKHNETLKGARNLQGSKPRPSFPSWLD